MKIRRAGDTEADVLTGIAFMAKRHWGYPESWIRSWAKDLTITPGYIVANPSFVATLDEQAAGFCALKLGAGEAVLDHLWVLPSSMGRGMGRALFEHAVEIARSGGASRMTIVGDPHAEFFYLRMGATLHGRESASMDGEARFLPLFEMLL